MIVEVIICLIILVFVYLWLYPHYISPLRHIPYPDGLPILGHTLQFLLKDHHQQIHAKWNKTYEEHGMHRLHHLLVNLLPFVVITNPEWIKHILSRTSEFPRSGGFIKFFPLAGDGLLTSSGDFHQFQKRVLGKAFTKSNLSHYVSVFDRHAQILVKVWEKLLSNEKDSINIDVKQYCNNFSFDIISEVAFGYQSNSQETGENSFVIAMKNQLDVFMNMKKRFILKVLPSAFVSDFRHDSKQVLAEILKTRKEKIMKGDLTESENNDLLSIMINGKDEKTGESFSDQLIQDGAFTFLIAGFETTASAIPIILYHFAQYPDMQERARAEIKCFFERKVDKDLTGDDLDEFSYTTAFIKESLRFLPTIPRNSRITAKACQFGKYFLPKGTLCVFNTNSVNRDPEKFDYPDEFIPERYMEGSSVKAGITVSFGYGPFNCIGKNFALQEMIISTVRILERFKVEVDPEYTNLSETQMITVKFKPRMLLRFRYATK